MTTPTQTGDKPMVTQRAIELLERAHAKGGLGYEAHGAIEYAINVLRHRAQETLSPEQPLDTIQRLGQEFDAPEASPSLGMGEAHGDRKCDACHRANPVWFAPSPLWNLVIGGPEATDDPGGVLCPICFIEKAEAAGVMPATGAWLVTKEPAASLTSPSPDLAEENERLREALEDTQSTLSAVKAEAIADGGGTCVWIAESLNQQMIDNRATLQSISTGKPVTAQ